MIRLSYLFLLLLLAPACAPKKAAVGTVPSPPPAAVAAPAVAEPVPAVIEAPTESAPAPAPIEARAPKPWPNPGRYEEAIAKFEAADAEAMPPEGAIVGVGSSSMRGWHKSIHEDLAPLTIIPRGFGGSCMNDALAFADRIVINYKPRAILLYEGDNDVAGGWAHDQIVEAYEAFFAKVHAALPETRIYVIAIKPSPSRWKHWPAMQAVNSALAASCARDPRLIFIDVATPMLGADGMPRPDIFLNDNLHMNRAGYEIWTAAVKPVLMEREAGFEAAP